MPSSPQRKIDMNIIFKKRKALYRKFLLGYVCLAAIPVMVLLVSYSKGAGWRPLLPGLPIYVTLFIGATYQFFKELRALKRDERSAADQLDLTK
jgi:hypothetical protein